MDDDFSDASELSSPPSSPIAPPGFFPSPPPSQEDKRQEGPPASKRRRVATPKVPKERVSRELDLTPDSLLSQQEQQSQVDLLVKTLRKHRKVVVIAGAGISTSAGSTCLTSLLQPFSTKLTSDDLPVPDFRSTDGLFKSLQKKHNLKASGKLLFDASVYQDDTLTASFQDMVRSLSEEAEKTSPTAFHHMLASLGQENRLTRLYTQNIDGIETAMPPLATQVPLNVKAPWPRTIQLHGSLDKMVCQKCRHLGTFDRDMFARPDAPECPECSRTNQFRLETGQRSHGVGKMRPRIVLYNEHNPDEEAITSVMNADIRSRPDALIVVGTSMKIPGVRRLVKSLCHVIKGRKNGVTMWINNEPPTGKEFEDSFDLMVKGDCEEVARLANLRRWDDHTAEFVEESEMEQAKGKLSVVIETPKKKQKTITAFPTPSSSHDEDVELPHKAPAKGRPTPASRGRNLKDVLGAAKTNPPKKQPAAKKPAAKPKAPKKGTKAQPKNNKITKFSAVTKGTAAGTDKLSKEEASKAMLPLPAGAARTNGPMSQQAGDKLDTIHSPSIPKGFDNLLNRPV